jgi:hypothetical protein
MNYRACVSIGTDYFVKFGHPDDLCPELQTQSYIFDYARSNPHPDAPRIPQVVHHFGDSRTKYLVMKFITLTAAPISIDWTAQALVLLWARRVVEVRDSHPGCHPPLLRARNDHCVESVTHKIAKMSYLRYAMSA